MKERAKEHMKPVNLAFHHTPRWPLSLIIIGSLFIDYRPHSKVVMYEQCHISCFLRRPWNELINGRICTTRYEMDLSRIYRWYYKLFMTRKRK